MVTFIEITQLSEFLAEKGIPFVLTGTSALSFYGLLPKDYEVGDIDIIITPSDADASLHIENELTSLAKLTGGVSDDYDGKSFTFYFGSHRVKVNAIMQRQDMVKYLKVLNGNYPVLNIHTPDEALKAKFSLHRIKDYTFCNNLITTITSYFNK